MNDIWYMLQDHDRYVYHYTRPSTLIDKILPTGKLRFSRFENVNDLRESRDWVFSYHTSIGADLGFDTTEPIEAQLHWILKHTWRVGCFVSDPYEAVGNKEREDRGEDIIGAAYERGHSRPRMWAQYGKDFKGACLVFDKARLDAEIRSEASSQNLIVHSGLVEYRNPRILPRLQEQDALCILIDEIIEHGVDRTAERHVARFWRDLFLVKQRDWEQEREFRWLVSGGDEDFFVDVRDSLVGIALGDHFPEAHKPTVGQYAETNGVSVVVMTWKNGVPQPLPTHWRLLKESQ